MHNIITLKTTLANWLLDNDDRNFKTPLNQVVCPVCEYKYVHVSAMREINSGDKWGVAWEGRGNRDVIVFWGECGHEWTLNFGFHKGETFTFIQIKNGTNYHEYIQSPEWEKRATIAKENAGWRCQLCNRSKDETVLHAHHRTYERLGEELPEDITVLCEMCHKKFHNID